MGIFKNVLIVSDLDGTLTNSSGKISDENREAIKYFCDEGGSFSICTSRPPQTFKNLLSIAPFNAPIVHSNGSLIYDHAAGRPVYCDYLDDTAAEICRYALNGLPGVCFEIFGDERSFVVNPSQITTNYHRRAEVEDTYISSPLEAEESWLKLALTYDDREALLSLRDGLEAAFPETRFIFSSPRYLEVMQHGIDKGFGAVKLAEHLGVSRKDLYTAGNFDNDAELLSVAAISFAPSNSSKELVEMADVILPDNDSSPFVALVSHLENIYKKREDPDEI